MRGGGLNYYRLTVEKSGVLKELLAFIKTEVLLAICKTHGKEVILSSRERGGTNKTVTAFSPFTSHVSRKRAAFTLAEVLITLGIIGVIAAITLPSLQQKMEQKSLRNAFLKQYRNMTTVMNEIQSEKGIAYECGNKGGGYVATECSVFWEDFLKRYKVLKSCVYRSEGCAVVYKKKAEVLAQGGSINNSNCSFLDSAFAQAYILVDGSIIYTSNNQSGVYFATDINGVKGPNRWGYDMFYMTLDTSKGQLRITDSVCAMYEKDGRRVKNMLLDTNDADTSFSG